MLGNVIAKLADGRKRSWLPFRNSKLTRLLQSHLGGNSRAVFIATIHPGVLQRCIGIHTSGRTCHPTLKNQICGRCSVVQGRGPSPESSVNQSQVRAGQEHAEETASTLRFAARAMDVQNMVRVNESLSQGETVRRLGKELDALMGPQQQRKIKQLELENQALHDEVLAPLFLTPRL